MTMVRTPVHDAVKRLKESNGWLKGLWFDNLAVHRVRQLVNGGLFMLNEDFMIKESPTRSTYFDIPWLFIPCLHPALRCDLWKAFSETFSFEAYYCKMCCHKVVLAIPTVKDLFEVAKIMEKVLPDNGWYGKCGVDLRDYTLPNYAAFIYGTSLEEAREIHERFLEYLPEHLRSFLIVKKGCTEMELNKPSSEWTVPTQEDIEMEARYTSMFVEKDSGGSVSDWFKNRLFHQWLHRALELKDDTVPLLVGSDARIYNKLTTYGSGFAQAVTYHSVKEDT